jgi:carbamoylphosphate synthase large subunit
MRVWYNRTFSSVHAALRLIRDADFEGCYEIVVSSPNPHALVQLPAHQFFIEPAKIIGSEYIDWCEKFCVEHGIDIFIPGKEAALLSTVHDRFAKIGTRIMSCASSDNLDIIHNKGRFYDLVRCDAAPAPACKSCATPDEFDSAYAQLRVSHSELCIKPSVSVYGIGFRRIREDRSAFALFSGGHDYQIDLISLRAMLATQASFPTLLVMEYLSGHEFSVDCIADHGTLKCAVARRKPLSVGGGQVIDAREDIQAACCEVVSQFGLNGYSNIQFRESEQGLRILEVNPRMSGGIAMACLGGPNLPYLGLAGFDCGYGTVNLPPVTDGLRVAEYNQAAVLP